MAGSDLDPARAAGHFVREGRRHTSKASAHLVGVGGTLSRRAVGLDGRDVEDVRNRLGAAAVEFTRAAGCFSTARFILGD